MASWPSDLPQEFEQDGFRAAGRENVLRSQVDAGPNKTRRRFTSAPYPIRGSMTMTGPQLDQFRDFLENEIADGAISFSFPKPRDPATVVTVKFNTTPQWAAARGDNFLVSLDLSVMPT